MLRYVVLYLVSYCVNTLPIARPHSSTYIVTLSGSALSSRWISLTSGIKKETPCMQYMIPAIKHMRYRPHLLPQPSDGSALRCFAMSRPNLHQDLNWKPVEFQASFGSHPVEAGDGQLRIFPLLRSCALTNS